MSKSNAPAFRTGTIVTPPSPKVTQRKSVTVKMGRDNAPLTMNETVMSSGTHYTSLGIVKQPRESLATEIAKRGQVTRVEVRVLTGAEQDVRDLAANVFRNSNGRVERTVTMGDAALPTERMIDLLADVPQTQAVTVDPTVLAEAAAKAAAKAERTAKAEAKAERDAEILAFLRAKGYKGTLNADIRVLALDAMEQARQVAEYATR
jgi:hypothetical protein